MPPHHHEIEKVRPHVDYLLIHLIFFAPDGINGNFVLKKGEKMRVNLQLHFRTWIYTI
jgi:hypothetical protein